MLLIIANPASRNTVGVKNPDETDGWQVLGVARDFDEAGTMTDDRGGSFIVYDLVTGEASAWRATMAKERVLASTGAVTGTSSPSA